MNPVARRRVRLLAVAITGFLADITYQPAWMFTAIHERAITLYRAAGELWWRHEGLDVVIYEDEIAEEDL